MLIYSDIKCVDDSAPRAISMKLVLYYSNIAASLKFQIFYAFRLVISPIMNYMRLCDKTNNRLQSLPHSIFQLTYNLLFGIN